ncbi:hypothetical protein BRYFOR_08479 [Marvinbryantia formatexigens DSM 14469]|uniref:Uncharacterized protein n=1 Tax=Marvinbryantia formatexigens DSM 14469 TaxID=478749 RepID=C6LIC5_9FIRM|nr:hypothetical protein BRYFOR_08479 [Marvinbryantia formatexigens DSM 14469]
MVSSLRSPKRKLRRAKIVRYVGLTEEITDRSIFKRIYSYNIEKSRKA